MRKIYCFLFLLITSFTAAQSPIPPGASLEKIAGGFQFVEGPVWVDSVGLLFSDISANTIYEWKEKDSSVSVFMKPSQTSNGLALDMQGRLVFTQMGLRRVVRQEKNGTITVLASLYKGKQLNSPNDVVVKSDGAVFFTDPPLNIPAGQYQQLSFSGIFRVSPFGSLQVMDSTLSEPNGICFSPDEKKLYVDDTKFNEIYVWDVINDSTISNKRKFTHLDSTGYADGMKTDPGGNIYSAGPGGIWIYSPDSALLGRIFLSTQTSNCNWGDSDRKTLYITSSSNVYRIRLVNATGVKGNGVSANHSFELYDNYPNPFNPSTVISWNLTKGSFVKLTIFDSLGNEVETLVNEFQNAGIHLKTFSAQSGSNGKTLSSGVYYYKLKSDDNIQVRKMMLLK
jgi:gluconolactonase